MEINWFLLTHTIFWPVVFILSWKGEILYQNLPELPFGSLDVSLPPLTIIVPARNEAHNLPQLLNALNHLQYPGELEIIVVDDNSSDATGDIAIKHGAALERLTELPVGWKGKPYACQRGADRAQGEWLLFTDADTSHSPHSAARAVSYAVRNGLDGLSLFLQQETEGWIDALGLSAAYSGLLAGTGSLDGFLNGQYILIRKQVFINSGGFASVGNAALEDVAFGHNLRANGFHLALLRGEHAGSVRMYHSVFHLWNGLTRLGSGTIHYAGNKAILSVLFVAQTASPLALAGAALTGEISWLFVSAAWLASVVILIPWAQRVKRPGVALLAPLGALLIAVSGVWGLTQRVSGLGHMWKGRRV